MAYEEVIEQTNRYVYHLKSKFKLCPAENSWVPEAIRIVERLITARDSNIPQDKYFQEEEYLYDKTVTSLSELTNLNSVLASIDKINKDSLKIFLNKLKKIFNAPLLMKDENYNSTEGRNTMFELRLFSKLVVLDFDARLPADQHPDILVNVEGNIYFIECKRIFKKETLVSNTQNAINQLLQYSLNDKLGYGIVALSVTRYFHAGDQRLEATTEEVAKKRIEYEMDILLKENKDEMLDIFPLKIPALFLEFSDRAVADKAYCVNLIDVVETANGRSSLFYKVKKDFNKLTSQVLV